MKEIWREIKGYERYYQVSNFGNIKRLATVVKRHIPTCVHNKFYKEHILKQSYSKGYLCVSLCKNGKAKRFQVHRLVAQAFIPNKLNKEQVNHKDGNRANNILSNLEWVTNTENQRHSFKYLGRVSGRKGKPMCDAMREELKKYQTEHYDKLCRKVKCVELNKIFIGITQARKELKVSKHISECCSGKRETCGGYHWEYVND